MINLRHPMKSKPTIHLSDLALFLKDGLVISDVEARAIWDGISGDWSQKAYQYMAARIGFNAQFPNKNPNQK